MPNHIAKMTEAQVDTHFEKTRVSTYLMGWS